MEVLQFLVHRNAQGLAYLHEGQIVGVTGQPTSQNALSQVLRRLNRRFVPPLYNLGSQLVRLAEFSIGAENLLESETVESVEQVAGRSA